jgi:acetyltransferase
MLPRSWQLRNGARVWVRPFRPNDVDHVVDIFTNLTPESRYRRFNQPLTDPDPEFVLREAQSLVDTTLQKGRGWLAFAQATGEPVGGARFIWLDDRSAECAVTIRDDYQRLGLGTRLLRMLLNVADRDGVEQLVAHIHHGNDGVIGLLGKLSLPFEQYNEGDYFELRIFLSAAGRSLTLS